MAYRHRKEIQDKFNMERSNPMITVSPKPKRVYHYNLTSSTQEDFDNMVQLNRSKKHLTQLDPLLRSLGQLTSTNVLTVKGYYNVRGSDVQNLRMKVLKMSKVLNISVETTFSKDKQALLVRLKRDWPVGVDISIGA